MKKARNILVVTLMLLSVLSFGSVANTYAKYTSTANLSDTAKVAKWDIELSDGTNTQKIWEAGTTINIFDHTDPHTLSSVTVDGKTTKIIAPGTAGSVNISKKITNKSDVDVKYTISFSELKNDSKIPLEYCVKQTCQEKDWKSIKEVTAIEGTLANASDTANNSVDIAKTLKWRWAFDRTKEVENDDGTKETVLRDDEDTALGIAGTATVELAVSITATQID